MIFNRLRAFVVFTILLLVVAGCGGGGNENGSSTSSSSSSSSGSSSSSSGSQIEVDKIAPVITLQGKKKILLSIGDTYEDEGATAIDNKDGDITSSIQKTENIDFDTPGEYTIIYQVADVDGNSVSIARKIIIQDIIAVPRPRAGLTINEVLSANTYIKHDPDYRQFSDWIELYNNDNEEKNIGGYYLSDDDANITKWRIPNGTVVPSKSYLLIWADNKDTNLHTNFKLSDKEMVVLADQGGNIIDSVELSNQKSDISSSKINDKTYYMKPTPASANTAAYGELWRSKKPDFSLASGFYDSVQTLSVTQQNSGDIYYTVDGSIPTENSILYTQPINIANTTVIRARSLENGKFFSSVKSQTFLINENITLPVVSLAINDEYLWDDKIGIHVIGTDDNGNPNPADFFSPNYVKDWMRPASIEYIRDGESKFSENIGVRIFGSGSRVRSQKSLSIYAKDRYGNKSIDYPLFPQKPFIKKVKSFILRNGGSDRHWVMRDALTQAMVKDNMDIDYQSYHPVVAFINGEYWGIFNIREKLNENYIEDNHNVDADNVDLLGIRNIVLSGSSRDYTSILDYVENNDMTDNANYQYIVDQIDLIEYMNYYITEIFVGNPDWPGRNVKYWKERSENSKWRWMLYDTENGYGGINPINHNTFDQVLNPNEPSPLGSPLSSTVLFRALMQNSTFKNELISKFTSHLNTTFVPERINKLINDLKAPLVSEIGRHYTKWSAIDPILEGYTQSLWNNNVNSLSNFADGRSGFVRGYMQSYLGADGSNMLQINSVMNGTVYIDDIKLTENFRGEYFNNAGVTLKAKPNKSYQFVQWSNGQTEKEISLVLNADVTISAEFVQKESILLPKIVINEFNYKSADNYNTGDWIELYNNDSKDIDISNWELKDDNNNSSFIIPNGTILTAGSYILFCESVADFNTFVPSVTAIGNFKFGLSKSEDTIRVFDDVDTLIDSVSYDKTFPDANGNGKTLFLNNPDSDNSLSENWFAIKHGTPGE